PARRGQGMRNVFLASFVLCGLLYLAAEATLSNPSKPGVVRLRWSTDPNPARNEQIAKFSGLFPGQEIVVDPGLGGGNTKLIAQCATGTGPDLIDMDGLAKTVLVGAGVLLDLTPYAKDGGFGPDQTYGSIGDLLDVDGRQYCFPCNISANAVIYNKKIFD